jgi:pilus assembly protein FimV
LRRNGRRVAAGLWLSEAHLGCLERLPGDEFRALWSGWLGFAESYVSSVPEPAADAPTPRTHDEVTEPARERRPGRRRRSTPSWSQRRPFLTAAGRVALQMAVREPLEQAMANMLTTLTLPSGLLRRRHAELWEPTLAATGRWLPAAHAALLEAQASVLATAVPQRAAAPLAATAADADAADDDAASAAAAAGASAGAAVAPAQSSAAQAGDGVAAGAQTAKQEGGGGGAQPQPQPQPQQEEEEEEDGCAVQ